MDISDEFKRVIQALEGYDDKVRVAVYTIYYTLSELLCYLNVQVRVVLNKADSMDPADILKVNSALTWALARILKAPEVRRIYVGSFWDQPLQPGFMNELYEKEAHALLADIASVPRNNTTAKLDDVVRRTRMVRVTAPIQHQKGLSGDLS